jgi:excisionase family DNA binding protein
MTKALSLQQAAQRIGVHRTTLRRWIVLGEGPRTFIKNGRRSTYRIAVADLDAFVGRSSKGGK